MLAGRAKIRGGLVDVNKGGRRRVHVESVRARQQSRLVIAKGPPIRCQQKYPSVDFTLRLERPTRTGRPSLPRRVAILESGVAPTSGGDLRGPVSTAADNVTPGRRNANDWRGCSRSQDAGPL
jgi:hypothetical protein